MKSPLRLLLRRLLRHRLAMGALLVLLLLSAAALFAGPLCRGLGKDPRRGDLLRNKEGPSLDHWFGLDGIGRDVFARILHGGRVSLSVGVVTAISAVVAGFLVGALAGYRGGRVDEALMRFTDAMLCVPALPLQIVLAATTFERKVPRFLLLGVDESIWKIYAILVLFGWMGVARLVRGSILSLKEREFVQASEALGARAKRVILLHLLPNCLAPVIVATTLKIGGNILAEAALSYLSLGIREPTASWGNMLEAAKDDLRDAPHLLYFPGAFILLTVACFNFLGDGLRDALDPRHVPGRRGA